MRHRKRSSKLGRPTAYRQALLANLVCSLIEEKQIQTTLARAKAARPLAERMVTLAKEGALASRRKALAKLHQKLTIKRLFTEIAPQCKDRSGGYTRIVKLGYRSSDNSPMAILEWVGIRPVDKKKHLPKEKTQKETKSK